MLNKPILPFFSGFIISEEIKFEVVRLRFSEERGSQVVDSHFTKQPALSALSDRRLTAWNTYFFHRGTEHCPFSLTSQCALPSDWSDD